MDAWAQTSQHGLRFSPRLAGSSSDSACTVSVVSTPPTVLSSTSCPPSTATNGADAGSSDRLPCRTTAFSGSVASAIRSESWMSSDASPAIVSASQ